MDRRTTAALTGLGLATSLVAGTAAPVDARGPSYQLILDLGQQYRWDPCEPVRYVVDTAGAPRGAMRDVRAAFRKVSAASGLRFTYAGPWTPATEAADGRGIVVVFRSGHDEHLRGRPVGTSMLSGLRWAGTTEIHRAWIYLERGYAARLRPGFGRGITRGQLLLHEIGHAVGLDHAGERREVMYPHLHRMRRTAFGPGDLAGLRAVGARQGCIVRALPAAAGNGAGTG